MLTTRIGGIAIVLAVSGGVGYASAESRPQGALTSDQLEAATADALSRIERGQTRGAQIESEVAGLAAKNDEAKARLHERARALYRIRRSGMLPVAGGFEAMLQHLSRVQRLSRMVKSDLKTVTFLDDRSTALLAEKKQLEQRSSTANAELQRWRAEKEKLAENRQSASTFDKVFKGTRRPAPRSKPRYGRIQVVDGWDDNSVDFARMRGELAFPIQGARHVRNATRDGAPGLEFVTQPGSSVRAAADGRVVFSKEYGAYGQMVIVDHGDSFFTVYGGLDIVDVEEGDWISMGARVGTVSDSAALFFEVRRGTRSLDARSWLGL